MPFNLCPVVAHAFNIAFIWVTVATSLAPSSLWVSRTLLAYLTIANMLFVIVIQFLWVNKANS